VLRDIRKMRGRCEGRAKEGNAVHSPKFPSRFAIFPASSQSNFRLQARSRDIDCRRAISRRLPRTPCIKSQNYIEASRNFRGGENARENASKIQSVVSVRGDALGKADEFARNAVYSVKSFATDERATHSRERERVTPRAFLSTRRVHQLLLLIVASCKVMMPSST